MIMRFKNAQIWSLPTEKLSNLHERSKHRRLKSKPTFYVKILYAGFPGLYLVVSVLLTLEIALQPRIAKKITKTRF